MVNSNMSLEQAVLLFLKEFAHRGTPSTLDVRNQCDNNLSSVCHLMIVEFLQILNILIFYILQAYYVLPA